MTIKQPITLSIAVPVPLRQLFDYLLPLENSPTPPEPGTRVRVSFQNRNLIGMVIASQTQGTISAKKLKLITEILDEAPILPEDILQLCQWAADYYHFPLGEVIFNALPSLLRQGKPARYATEIYYQLSEIGKNIQLDSLKRSPRQIELLNLLNQHPEGLTTKQLKKYHISKTIINALYEKKYIIAANLKNYRKAQHTPEITTNLSLELNPEQKQALDTIQSANNAFNVFLLDGVTGSGKTEVYLQAISDTLNKNKQVLVLVPEIGLTPQTIQRFRQRFAVSVIAIHSGLSERERLNAWLAAKQGDAAIIIGTRSAIFTPFTNLGLIIVDEEHDLSFKQQEGLRYHARDLAIMRAYYKNIPIILGSATPALETLQKAKKGRYHHLKLTERAGNAQLPAFHILDIRKASLEQGLSLTLLNMIEKHIHAGNQVMLFLNRRGYAPVLMCHSCGWIAICKRCDARMTYHQSPAHLHCHHCSKQKMVPLACEACKEKNLTAIGLGTERLEFILQKHFPDANIARIDRDTTQRKGTLEELLDKIQQGHYQILIGTQMLAKGHHFPNVTLVAIVDTDSGFFSSDFRGLERMGQLVTQVAGRSGRVDKPGTVVIQTHHPEHPLLYQLTQENYQQFAFSLLEERKLAHLPPFSFLALFRAEALNPLQANTFLTDIKTIAQQLGSEIQLLGPISAPMPKRDGKHRSQLLLQTSQRPLLQNFLKTLIPEIEKISSKQRVRWSLDVDPLEMF